MTNQNKVHYGPALFCISTQNKTIIHGWVMPPYAMTNAQMTQTMCKHQLIHVYGSFFRVEGRKIRVDCGLSNIPLIPVTTPMHHYKYVHVIIFKGAKKRGQE